MFIMICYVSLLFRRVTNHPRETLQIITLTEPSLENMSAGLKPISYETQDGFKPLLL